MRRWTPPIRNRFAIGGAASPGLRPLRGHLVTMDDLPVSRLGHSPTRKFPFFLFYVYASFFTDTQFPFFLFLRVCFFFQRHAISLFFLFCVSALLFRDTQFLIFSFLRVRLLFFPTRNFSFSLFCVSAFLFRDTQFLVLVKSFFVCKLPLGAKRRYAANSFSCSSAISLSWGM